RTVEWPAMKEWFEEHGWLVWWMTGFSIGTIVLTVLLLPLFVSRIPADYFVRKELPPESWRGRHPLIRWTLRAVKNALGAALVLVGIPLVPLPGPGFVTILAGLALVDFPGKRRLELRVLRVGGVLEAANWVRSRAGRPPLVVDNPSQPVS
ncbi:MAG: PGPGW domain-containing protein, partial [Planctomycetota bacterium]